MAWLLARQKAHMKTSHPDKDHLCHQSLYGAVASRKYRTRPKPICPQTTVPELYHHHRRFRSRSLVESAKDPTFTLSEIAEHGYTQDCRGLQDYPYCSARSRTWTPPSRPTTRSDTTRLHRPLIHPTRKPPPTTALPRQFSQNTRQPTRTATR